MLFSASQVAQAYRMAPTRGMFRTGVGRKNMPICLERLAGYVRETI
jgi:hypothetical protein